MGYPEHYRGVKELVDSGISSIPNAYIPPQGERPSPPASCSDTIPVIDLSQSRPDIVKGVKQACEQWGFFQVINHGVPGSVIEQMFSAGLEFHQLPNEEKMRYFSTDPWSKMRYGTSFNVANDQVLNWRDFLRHGCKPFSEICELLPDKPSSYRGAVADYSKHMSKLGEHMLELISQSLGLQPDYISQAFGEASELMASNYYPACPQPELALGFARHTDPGAFTLLVQDDVGGLEIAHGDTWIAIKPFQGAVIVNLADQLQILTNGRYKSAEHRARVNSCRARMSLAYVFGPAWETVVEPAPKLVAQDGRQVYRPCRYEDFMVKIQSRSLAEKRVVFDELRI